MAASHKTTITKGVVSIKKDHPPRIPPLLYYIMYARKHIAYL